MKNSNINIWLMSGLCCAGLVLLVVQLLTLTL